MTQTKGPSVVEYTGKNRSKELEIEDDEGCEVLLIKIHS